MLWEFNQHRENWVGTFFEVYHSKVFEAVGGRWKMATCLFAVKLAAQLEKAVSQLGLCPDVCGTKPFSDILQ
jgi:hypothetical protein